MTVTSGAPRVGVQAGGLLVGLSQSSCLGLQPGFGALPSQSWVICHFPAEISLPVSFCQHLISWQKFSSGRPMESWDKVAAVIMIWVCGIKLPLEKPSWAQALPGSQWFSTLKGSHLKWNRLQRVKVTSLSFSVDINPSLVGILLSVKAWYAV